MPARISVVQISNAVILRVPVNAALAAGDITAVAAITDKRIIPISLTLKTSVDEQIALQSGATVLGNLNLTAVNASETHATLAGLVQTTAGEAFVISPATGTTVVDGFLSYVVL